MTVRIPIARPWISLILATVPPAVPAALAGNVDSASEPADAEPGQDCMDEARHEARAHGMTTGDGLRHAVCPVESAVCSQVQFVTHADGSLYSKFSPPNQGWSGGASSGRVHLDWSVVLCRIGEAGSQERPAAHRLLRPRSQSSTAMCLLPLPRNRRELKSGVSKPAWLSAWLSSCC